MFLAGRVYLDISISTALAPACHHAHLIRKAFCLNWQVNLRSFAGDKKEEIYTNLSFLYDLSTLPVFSQPLGCLLHPNALFGSGAGMEETYARQSEEGASQGLYTDKAHEPEFGLCGQTPAWPLFLNTYPVLSPLPVPAWWKKGPTRNSHLSLNMDVSQT